MRLTKCLVVVVGLELVASISSAQSLAWDYPDWQVREMEIVRFEVRFDGQTPVPVEISGLPGVAESYFTPVTFQKFTAKKGMTSGEHRVEVRACSSTTCFEWSTPLVFVVSPSFGVTEVKEFGAPL